MPKRSDEERLDVRVTMSHSCAYYCYSNPLLSLELLFTFKVVIKNVCRVVVFIRRGRLGRCNSLGGGGRRTDDAKNRRQAAQTAPASWKLNRSGKVRLIFACRTFHDEF